MTIPCHGRAITFRIAVLLLMAGGCKRPAVIVPRDKPAVVVVDPDEELESESQKEREPNDSREQAQLIPLNEILAGTLRGGGAQLDHDWYRLEINHPDQLLRVESRGAAKVDLGLSLYDGDGAQIVSVNNAGVGGGETITNVTLPKGPYWLEVAALSSDASATVEQRSYRLRAVARPVEPSEEREPNGSDGKAGVLEWDGEAVGYCGWRHDVDWFSITPPQSLDGLLLRAELDGVDGVRPKLSVVAGGKTVLQRVASEAGEAVVLANVRPPAAGEKLFVVVHCGKGFNLEARYAVRIATSEGADMEQEPNDSAAAATAVSLERPARGILADRADRDLFRPAVPVGTMLRVVARPPVGLDVALALIGADNKVVKQVDARRSGGVEVLVPVFWQAGMLLQVRAPRAASVDPVSPYRIGVEPLDSANWEQEPNDQPAQAQQLIGGPTRSLKGFLHPADDLDHYVITAPGPNVRLSLQAPAGLPIKVELRDGDTVVASAEGGAGGGRLWLDAAVEPQKRYVLRLSGDGVRSDPDQPYGIDMVQVAPVGPAPTADALGAPAPNNGP